MKITPTYLAVIRAAVAPLDTPERRAAYLAGDFPRADKVQDLDKRYRWDLVHVANRMSIDLVDNTMLIGTLYDAGYHDAHIDTALRAIVPPLGVSIHATCS
jgi:hypothetical protein